MCVVPLVTPPLQYGSTHTHSAHPHLAHGADMGLRLVYGNREAKVSHLGHHAAMGLPGVTPQQHVTRLEANKRKVGDSRAAERGRLHGVAWLCRPVQQKLSRVRGQNLSQFVSHASPLPRTQL